MAKADSSLNPSAPSKDHSFPDAVQVAIYLDPPSVAESTVRWSLSPGSARASEDYSAASGLVLIKAGQRDATISIDVLGDTVRESTENVVVRASVVQVVNGRLLEATADLEIVDDDSPADPACTRATVRWAASTSSGRWSDPANWLPRRVPGANDVVCVEASPSGTTEVDIPIEVRELDVGGNLSVGSHLHISDLTALSRLTGGVKVESGGRLTIDGALVVSGQAEWEANSTIAGPGLLRIDRAGVLRAQGGPCLARRGVVSQNFQGDCLALDITYVENFGVFDLQRGTLIKENGGAVANGGLLRLGSPNRPREPFDELRLYSGSIVTASYPGPASTIRVAPDYLFANTGTIEVQGGSTFGTIEAARVSISGNIEIGRGAGAAAEMESGLAISSRAAVLDSVAQTSPFSVLDLRGVATLGTAFAFRGFGYARCKRNRGHYSRPQPALASGGWSTPCPSPHPRRGSRSSRPSDWWGGGGVGGAHCRGPATLSGGSKVTIAAGASGSLRGLLFSDGNLVNNGTLEVRNTNTGQGTFTNRGRLVLLPEQGQRPVVGGDQRFRVINAETGTITTGTGFVSGTIGSATELRGRIDVTQGVLQLHAGPDALWTTRVTAAAGTTIEVANNNVSPLRLVTPFAFTGGGRLRLTVGVIQVGVPLSLPELDLNARVSFEQPATVGSLNVLGVVTGGEVVVSGVLTARGPATLSGGSKVTIPAGPSGSLRGLLFSDGNLVNNGTLEVRNTNTGQGTFTNRGRLVLLPEQGQRPVVGGDQRFRVINAETGTITTGTGFVSGTIGSATELRGRIDVTQGVLQLHAGPDALWTTRVTAAAGTTIEVANNNVSPLRLVTPFAFTGGGRLRLTVGVIQVGVPLSLPELDLNARVSFEQPATVGSLNVLGVVTGGEVVVSGVLTARGPATLSGGSKVTIAAGASGSLRGLLFSDGNLVNNGTLEVRNTNTGQGTFTNRGRLVLLPEQGQRPVVGGDQRFRVINAETGTITTGTGFVSGTIGDVLNRGTLEVAGSGSLAVASFTQTSTGVLRLELRPGATPMIISTSAVLDGTLRYTLVSGATAPSGSQLPIASYASRAGTFATVIGAPPGVISYQPSARMLVD